jgi:hypothetical protein
MSNHIVGVIVFVSPTIVVLDDLAFSFVYVRDPSNEILKILIPSEEFPFLYVLGQNFARDVVAFNDEYYMLLPLKRK